LKHKNEEVNAIKPKYDPKKKLKIKTGNPIKEEIHRQSTVIK